MFLAHRWRAVNERLRRAQDQYGRAPGSVTVVAASKSQSIDTIRQLAGLGQRLFGENYLQEACPKQDACGELDLEWHFIGALQSNKAAEVARRFDWVHTVASLPVAQRLSAARPTNRPPLNICLQVNIDRQASKAGIAPEAAADLARAVAQLPGLKLRGLMSVPAPAVEFAVQRQPLRALRELLEALCRHGVTLDTLSMGMSDDLEAAVAEGATLVRIGTALFGPRQAAPGTRP